MNGWLSTILFSACALFSVPVNSMMHKAIYQLFFNRYNPMGLWEVYYAEMESMQFTAAQIIGWICVLVFLLFVISSLLLMRKGNAKRLLLQAIVSQGVILLWQIGLIVVLILVALVSSLNLLGGVVTLPLFIGLVVTLELLLTFAGALRGISGVFALRRSHSWSSAHTVLHVCFQFIPVFSIIDNLRLRSKVANG